MKNKLQPSIKDEYEIIPNIELSCACKVIINKRTKR